MPHRLRLSSRASVLLTLAVAASTLLPHAARADVIFPARGVYNCIENNYSECRNYSTRTPPIESCAEWGAWVIANVLGGGGPYNVVENFGESYNTLWPSCSVVNAVGGGLNAWGHKDLDCPAGFNKVVGPNSLYKDSCRGTELVPSKTDCTIEGPCGQTNPVNLRTGNKFQVETDYAGSGLFPLTFTRYHSSSRFLNAPYNHERHAEHLGNWRHSYSRRVVDLAYFNNGQPGTHYAQVERADGRVVSFYLNPDTGEWIATGDEIDKLVKLPNGWRYHVGAGDGVETYDSAGRLISIQNRAGAVQTLTYSAQGQLAQITDTFGRALKLTYDSSARVQQLTDPAGSAIVYTYDALGNLATVTYPGNAVRTYHYEHTAHPRALTGISDENIPPQRIATWTYDAQKRANLSVHGPSTSPVDRVAIAYTANGATTIDALGKSRTYTYATVLGAARHTSTSAPCEDCGAAFSTYDNNGFLTSRTDFNNNKTCFTHDARGLETLRVEGLPATATCPYSGALTGAQRQVSTEWHPEYRLPIRIAEPLRLTTYHYGASNDPNPGNRGSLLSATVRTTTDATGIIGFSATTTGPARTWTYTYNPHGAPLLVDGPRTDVADTRVNTYYADNAICTTTHPDADSAGCRGQLHTRSNAAGHLTTVREYNAHGQPLVLIDPNGLTTTLTYDARQRLVSRRVGTALTQFTYDNAGQLIRVTLPDTSALEYRYDSVHRLTALHLKDAADALVGQFNYTLDAAGNLLQESLTDATQSVLRTHRQVFNDLSRLVQSIGAKSDHRADV